MKGEEVKQYQFYINGEWIGAESGKTFKVLNPYTEEVIAEVPNGGREDAQKAIDAAREAFDSGVWSGLPAKRRSQIMLDITQVLTSKQSELAELEARSGGLTIRTATLVDMSGCIEIFRYFAELAESISFYEPVLAPEFPASYNYVLREPVGVCGEIVPWNYPLLMAFWKLAPALAVGNTVVLKPASYTPLTALELARIIDESEIPKGVVNIITGPGSTVGEEIASNPKVDKVTFTGSTEVGRRIMELASSTIKRVTLELGGKSPVIVLEDANLDVVVDGVVFGGFLHCGQICTTGSRLLLPESIHDKFLEKLVERVSHIKLGDNMEFDTDMGPLVSAKQRDKVESYIKSGLEEGAKLVCGGGRPKGPQFDKGYFVEPTIFVEVKNTMKIAQEEIFGPVLSVIKYSTVDEAISIANATTYGLTASVWSEDMGRAMEISQRIKAGTVWINEHHMLSPLYPFGGYKQSGIGREGGVEGLYDFTEIKHVYMDLVRKREGKFWYNLACSG